MPGRPGHQIGAIGGGVDFSTEIPVVLNTQRGWLLEAIKKYIFDSGPDTRNPPDRPGTAAPDPPDIFEQPREMVDFEAGVGDRLANLTVSRAKR